MLEASAAQGESAFAVPESTTISERIVVSPTAGRFRPLPAESFAPDGEWVEPGATLGEIAAHGESIPVRSPFRGWVMGMLSLANQPVKEGEALFWIWGC